MKNDGKRPYYTGKDQRFKTGLAMRFLCPFCNAVITVENSALGYRTVCSSCGKSVLVPSGEFDEGRVIGDFAIRSKLGEGSIGAVYKAYQISLERVVALKILTRKFETAKGVTEFLHEARNAARLCHTNLVQSYAVGAEDGLCYMAMTYVTGETLRARIQREGAIPCDEALHIVQQVAEALHCAWTEAGMIHRDVKPDNIMLSEHGVVKLTDLGLAMNHAEWREDMDISGSPSYMSPEQFAGEKLDTRSDIYSLGVTLYQMLCGKLPFDAETIRSIARQHFECTPPSLAEQVPGLPSRVVALVSKMMAKLPEKRFRDMDELLREIWHIRQSTAPDRTNIPDVHTISMRRLDYEVQKKALQPAHPNGTRSSSHTQRFGQVFYWVMAAVPLLAIIILLTLVLIKTPEKSGDGPFFTAIDKDIAMFENLSSDTSLSAGEVELEAVRLIEKLERHLDDSVRARALRSHILYLMKDRVADGHVIDPEGLTLMENERDEFRRENRSLKTEIDSLRIKLDEASVAVSELDTARAELTNLRILWNDREKSIQDEYGKLSGINSLLIDFLKMEISVHSCEAWQKQRFVGCADMIDYAKSKYPFISAWLEDLRIVNQLGRRLASVFDDSGTKYAGRKFGKDPVKTVVSIDGGKINYTEPGGIAKSVPWTGLSQDDVWAIVSNNTDLFPSEGLTRAVFELLSGNVGAAWSVKPETGFLPDILSRYEAYCVFLIRMECDQNRERAAGMLQTFRRRFAGMPSFEKEAAELQKLLERK